MDTMILARHLAEALTFPTVEGNEEAKENFLAFLERTYPRVHGELSVEVVGTYSRIYQWKGKNAQRLPVLLTAHYDVVPVEEGTQHHWTCPPFSGEIRENFVYGRGALDDKNQVICILETLERALEKGEEPQRDIYFALGHDEEVGGKEGAQAMAKLFQDRGLIFSSVLDEGGAVVEDALPGFFQPFAFVGVAEKGSSMVQLRVQGEGGHSSMPAGPSSVAILAQAIARLTENPMKIRLTPVVERFLQELSGVGGVQGFLLRRPRLFFPLLGRSLEKIPTMNAMLRTTMAVTRIQGGEADNLLPQEAWALVNVRLLPGDTLEEVLQEMKKIVRDLPVVVSRITVEEASSLSPRDTPEYEALKEVIGEIFPKIPVLPYIMAGSSDSRKYEPCCRNIFRFSAVKLTSADLTTVHGTDERVSLENLETMFHFYQKLLLR